jgi:two-component sensor histidine kinase
VRDDGAGLGDKVELDGSTGFGLRLVDMLAKQLHGSIEIDRSVGTKFTLTFSV